MRYTRNCSINSSKIVGVLVERSPIIGVDAGSSRSPTGGSQEHPVTDDMPSFRWYECSWLSDFCTVLFLNDVIARPVGMIHKMALAVLMTGAFHDPARY